MADETTATTVADTINTSSIREINDYPIDANVLLPRLAFAQVGGTGTNTAKFSVPTKSTAVAAPGDGTAFANAPLAFTGVTAAAAEFGIMRVATKGAMRFSVTDIEGFAKADGARLCLEYMETLALAQLTNASLSVGTTGQTMTAANMSSAISKASIAKAKGNGYFILTTFQARDLRTELTQSGGVILTMVGGPRVLEGPDAAGFTGTFMGKPTYETNLTPAASSDEVGAYLMDESMKMAPIGCALGWMPEVEQVTDATYPGQRITVTASAGFVEKQDKGYVKIVTIGS